ncbi:MAG: efflux RND transporter periplasmic adaptor subunit [Ideonella sp.]|nr:MAG: efflux RND transporter periplasmic adaptor subunit [Burkholderiaceae bacterium]MBE7427413.1 efflux RND transporter periplasmic adaptor subunit [Ideonella sp.]
MRLPSSAVGFGVVAERATLCVAAVLLASCGAKEGGAPAGPPAMPPPQVGVVTVQPHAVVLSTELPGRVEALRVAQVRARVNGVVLRRLFVEGSEVKAGQPLFQIDPAPYQAALDQASATLAKARANRTVATELANRYKPLAEAKAVSQQDYANAEAARLQAEADVAAGLAAVQTAKLNLDYAHVSAPIAGHIGRAVVTEGALVSAAEATLLATIQQVGTVYVNFTQPSAEVLRLRRMMETNQLRKVAGGQGAEVRVVLDDGSELARPGKLLFTDLTVDPTSGQVTLRAEVPNPERLLLPGQYVRVRISQAELPSAVLLPQQAVTRTAQGDSVLVVGADNKPQTRAVQLGQAQGNDWIVRSGLAAGERVIVDGFQKMMVPGAPVAPVPWSAPVASARAASSVAPVRAASAAGKASK